MLPGDLWEGFRDTPPYWVCTMERSTRRTAVGAPRGGARQRRPPPPPPRGQNPRPNNTMRKAFPADYFSVESLLVLLCLTASLVILPLVLPPLPPPPFLLLLVPVGILALLMVLALMASDVRDIASCL